MFPYASTSHARLLCNVDGYAAAIFSFCSFSFTLFGHFSSLRIFFAFASASAGVMIPWMFDVVMIVGTL